MSVTTTLPSPRNETLSKAGIVLPAFEEDAGAGLQLTRLMHLFWLGRADLHDAFPLDSQTGRVRFASWCLFEGRHTHSGLKRHCSIVGARLSSAIVEYSRADGPPISLLLDALWRYRPDLQETFSIETRDGREGFLRWLVLYGWQEYRLFDLVSLADLRFWAEPEPSLRQDSALGLTRLAYAVWQARLDLQEAFDLQTQEGREAFVRWFVERGVFEQWFLLEPALLSEDQCAWLGMPASNVPISETPVLTRLMLGFWLHQPSIQQRFPLSTVAGRKAFAGWFNSDNMAFLLFHPLDASSRPRLPQFLTHLWEERRLFQEQFDEAVNHAATLDWFVGLTEWHASAAAEGLAISPTTESTAASYGSGSPLPRGVAVFANSDGPAGYQEDARMMATALVQAGVLVELIDIGRSGARIELATPHIRTKDWQRAIHLVCLPPGDAFVAMDGVAKGNTERAFLIVAPRWTPEIDGRALWSLDLADEIWVSTRFAKGAFQQEVEVPVARLPLCVSAATGRRFKRQEFGLPDDRFLFGCVVDRVEDIQRKNPLAVLQAFIRAFPWGDEPVGLVLNIRGVEPAQPLWWPIAELIQSDPRIHLIDASFDRNSMLGFLSVLDVQVSLHRVQASGRTLIEAMQLDKPVIVTGYSGTPDEGLPDLCCITGYKLVPAPVTTLSREEFWWAEPDVDHAVWHMQRLAADPELCQRLGGAAGRYAREVHGIEAVGLLYRKRLETLGLL